LVILMKDKQIDIDQGLRVTVIGLRRNLCLVSLFTSPRSPPKEGRT
jgi:hypothetical protein